MKKLLISVLFFMFFSANAVLAVTYSSRPVIPFTEDAAWQLTSATKMTEYPVFSKNDTKAQILEKKIKYFNNLFENIGYDCAKSTDKVIHQLNINPMNVSSNPVGMVIMGYLEIVLLENYTKSEEYVLKKYFSQETVNYFNKRYEEEQKNQQNVAGTVVQKQTETNPYQSSIEANIKKLRALANQYDNERLNMIQEQENLSKKEKLGIVQNIDNEYDLLHKKGYELNVLYMNLKQIILKYEELNDIINQKAITESEYIQACNNLQAEISNIQKKHDYIMSVKNAHQLNYGNTNYNYQNTYNQNNTSGNANSKNYSNVINETMGIVKDLKSIIKTWK